MEIPMINNKTSNQSETYKQNYQIQSKIQPGRGQQIPRQSPIYEPINNRQSTFSQSSSSPSPSYSNISRRCPQPNYSHNGMDFYQQVPEELESEEYNQGKSPQYYSIQQNNPPMQISQPQYHKQPYLQYLPVQQQQQKRQQKQLNYSQDSYEQINSNPMLNYQLGQQQQPQQQHFQNPQYFNDSGMYSNQTRFIYTANQENLFEQTRQNLSRLLPTQPRDRATNVQSSISNLGMQNYSNTQLKESYQNEQSNDNYEFRSNSSLNYSQQGQQFQQRQQQQQSPQQYRGQQQQYQSQESRSYEGHDSYQSQPSSEYKEKNSQPEKQQKEWYEQQDDDEDDDEDEDDNNDHLKDTNMNIKAEQIDNSPKNTQQSDDNTNVTTPPVCCSNKRNTIQHTVELQQYLHNKQMKTKYIESSSNSIVSGIIDLLNTHSKKNKCIVKEIFHEDQRKYTCCSNCKELANEIQILSKLNHPSIIPINNNQNYSNQPILKLPHSCAVFLPRAIMDLFDFALIKPDTSDYTKRNYQLLKMAFKQTAEAIDYLHKKNIIHGDIKPENILVFSQTQFKLADFGFAKQVQTYRSRQSFLDRFKDRSLKYYPPEVSEALEDGNYDLSKIDEFSKDVFALGVSMFQVFFKSFPYENETVYCNVYDENAEEKYYKEKYFHRADKIFGILYNPKKTHLFWNKFQEIENVLTIGKSGCASMKLLEMNQLKQLIAHSITPVMYQRYSIQEFLQHPFFAQMK